MKDNDRGIFILPNFQDESQNRYSLMVEYPAACGVKEGMKSVYWHKSHNVTVLMYHVVFPAKSRRPVVDKQVDAVIKEVFLKIEKRYQVKFLAIGQNNF